MGYYEFFTRALKPGIHYVEVDPDNLCDDLVNKVGCTPAKQHQLISNIAHFHSHMQYVAASCLDISSFAASAL